MTDEEIIYDDLLQGYEPCGTCLAIAMDAAYGKSRPDDDDYEFVVLDDDFDNEQQYEMALELDESYD